MEYKQYSKVGKLASGEESCVIVSHVTSALGDYWIVQRLKRELYPDSQFGMTIDRTVRYIECAPSGTPLQSPEVRELLDSIVDVVNEGWQKPRSPAWIAFDLGWLPDGEI